MSYHKVSEDSVISAEKPTRKPGPGEKYDKVLSSSIMRHIHPHSSWRSAHMQVERRRKRSSFASLSLQYWLSAVAQQKKLMALVLADSAGLLVASSFHGPEAEELAAMAPLLARPGEPDSPLMELPQLPVEIQPMSVDCTSLYLCAVGDRARIPDGMRLAAGGVLRILTTH
jgi:hypothetical protein